MHVLSLFDGISCGMVALERSGILVEKYHAYEIDKYATAISKRNYPEIDYHGDVFYGNFRKYKNCDLLIGGSPCTYWSVAKKASDSFVYNNLVAVPVRIGHIGKGGLGERIYSVYGKSVSMKANGGGGGAKTGLYKIDLPDGDYIIRKLYPIEAERLQTLPDNYTAGVSNTQRYKCIGNGWTVDVIAHILGFIPK